MLARFSRYMQPAVDVAHLKDLIAKMTFSASQDPDVLAFCHQAASQ
jgi:hypothetical protein